MKPIRIAVAGAMGRMGQAILRLAVQDTSLSVEGALELETHPQLGSNLGELLGVPNLPVTLTDRPDEALKSADILIAFTTPAATMNHLGACVRARKKLVIGTTGLAEKDFRSIRQASKKIAIVQSPNMSVGINLLLRLTELMAQKLGQEYDIEIVETHHRMKKDAPSGTALKLAEVAAKARGLNFSRSVDYGRHGLMGTRKRGAIGIHARRGGDVIGEHTIEFMAAGERLGLFHQASSRDAFASGALLAAKFLFRKGCGLWSMQDVLAL